MSLHATVRSALAVIPAVSALLACGDDASDARAPGSGRVDTATAIASGGTAGTGGTGGTGGGDTSTGRGGHGGADECGPFDPDGDGDDDGPRHDSPRDPEILASCGALCDALGDVCGSGLDRDACIDSCRLRACDACRRTFVPVVDCESVETQHDSCTCDDGVPRCPIAPSRCSDYLDATTQCAR